MLWKVLIVADDLTGAMDAAAQFAVRGLKTELFLKPDAECGQESEVIVIDTESRNLSASEAKKRVQAAVEPWLPVPSKGLLFKKIDSTLRGNVGSELETLLAVTHLKSAVVAPAFPANARIVVGGHILVGQVPLLRSYAGRDVYTPVHSSYLPELLRHQTSRPMTKITLQQLEKGRDVVLTAFEEVLAKGKEIVLFDTAEQEDLDLIVESVQVGRDNVIWVGSAGLAQALADELAQDQPLERTGTGPRQLKGKTLILYGSPNQVCKEQIAYLGEHLPAVPIKPVPVEIFQGESEQEKVVSKYVTELKQSNVFALAVSCSNLSLDLPGGPKVSWAIRDFLATLATRAIKEAGVTNLVLSGGDTARAVFERLGIAKVDLQTELLPGIPVARAKEHTGCELAVITKAGGFGPPDTLVQILAHTLQE
ncbi:MAG TPA: four-carbon acid sugar kinase family protein [Firmicutes bacterium]|nr:four-carbon acid sugar kinase family protein [Bacillota bacterium]